MRRDDLQETSAWRRPSSWLGCAEIATGAALGVSGCYAGFATGMSGGGFVVLFSLCGAVVVLVVPGASLLVSRHWLRWLPQLAPIGVLAWIVVRTLR